MLLYTFVFTPSARKLALLLYTYSLELSRSMCVVHRHAGTLALQHVEDDTRMLALKATHVEQSLKGQPALPDAGKITEEIEQTRSATVDATNDIEQLSAVMESTESKGRYPSGTLSMWLYQRYAGSPYKFTC